MTASGDIVSMPDPYRSREPADQVALLTETEHELLTVLGTAANLFGQVIGRHPNTHAHDLGEVVAKVHDLQARVMAQAAARAYPDRYRLLGSVLVHKEG